MAKYRVVTLCGSTRFKKDFEEAQKKLTLDGSIVISVGLFGHSGDNEVWENMDEGTVTKTKRMLDDMHKSKIDMADEIFVINPDGYIGESTWSEICYAYMTDKAISSLEYIDRNEIASRVEYMIRSAQICAAYQYDVVCHKGPYTTSDLVTISYKRNAMLDPWMPLEENVPTVDSQYGGDMRIDHVISGSEHDPFNIYGKKKMARFVVDILNSDWGRFASFK